MDVTAQRPQLHVIETGFRKFLNNIFSSVCTRAGRIKSVAMPDNKRMAEKNSPTVLYGTSGAATSGRKPNAITMIFLIIARAGSSNIRALIDAQVLSREPKTSICARVKK